MNLQLLSLMENLHGIHLTILLSDDPRAWPESDVTTCLRQIARLHTLPRLLSITILGSSFGRLHSLCHQLAAMSVDHLIVDPSSEQATLAHTQSVTSLPALDMAIPKLTVNGSASEFLAYNEGNPILRLDALRSLELRGLTNWKLDTSLTLDLTSLESVKWEGYQYPAFISPPCGLPLRIVETGLTTASLQIVSANCATLQELSLLLHKPLDFPSLEKAITSCPRLALLKIIACEYEVGEQREAEELFLFSKRAAAFCDMHNVKLVLELELYLYCPTFNDTFVSHLREISRHITRLTIFEDSSEFYDMDEVLAMPLMEQARSFTLRQSGVISVPSFAWLQSLRLTFDDHPSRHPSILPSSIQTGIRLLQNSCWPLLRVLKIHIHSHGMDHIADLARLLAARAMPHLEVMHGTFTLYREEEGQLRSGLEWEKGVGQRHRMLLERACLERELQTQWRWW